MKTTKIYDEIRSGDIYAYIGRYNKKMDLKASALANPYHIGKDGNREQVIAKFRLWLWEEIKKGTDSPAYRELCSLTIEYRQNPDLKLACYCYPLACHGDIIIKAIEWLNDRLP